MDEGRGCSRQSELHLGAEIAKELSWNWGRFILNTECYDEALRGGRDGTGTVWL